jgi:hypothetical protein
MTVREGEIGGGTHRPCTSNIRRVEFELRSKPCLGRGWGAGAGTFSTLALVAERPLWRTHVCPDQVLICMDHNVYACMDHYVS